MRLPAARIVAPAPLGDIWLVWRDGVLLALDFGSPEARLMRLLRRRFGQDVALEESEDIAGFGSAVEAYLGGRWDALGGLAVDGGGTPFQLEVWAALRDIPAGETRSYGQIAAAIGRPAASRAVGLANGLNPINLVVPCHRVIGGGGALTGYGGGLERKGWLLAHERPASFRDSQPPASERGEGRLC